MVINRAERLKEKIRVKRDEIESAVADLNKQYGDGDVPSEDVKAVRAMDADLESLLADYSEAAQDEQRASTNRAAMAQIFSPESVSVPTPSGPVQSIDRRKVAEAKNLSDVVLANGDFQEWHNRLTANGTKPISSKLDRVGQSPPIEVSLEMATLVTGLSSTSGGAFVVNDRKDIVVPLTRNDLNILDLLTIIPTDSDNVDFVRATTETNAAAGVAEATSTSDGAKPESALAWVVVTSPIETIAHLIPVTRRALADARQLAAFIDNFLLYGLRNELATQVVSGATTPDLVGIANTGSVQSQAFDTDIFTTTRKAKTLVKTVGGASATAYVLPPESWETIDLLQDNENRYYYGGPARMGTPILWGLPVVESEHVGANTAYVGDWRQAVLWDRMQATIYMTDSHSDWFARNIIALLAEMRAGFSLLKPSAFVEVALA